MAIRKIVHIDEKKCNGCGLCVQACHEGALRMIDGKARLIKDDYCDGLGDCLPECPTGAITITEREAADYDEQAVLQRQKAHRAGASPHGCPGSMQKTIKHQGSPLPVEAQDTRPSQLRQWPVQLRLINSRAEFLQGAHLLLAADCTPLAYASFHEQLLQGRVAIIACPKLDDYQEIVDRLAEILQGNDIASITVARMEVPCCGGLTHAVKQAIEKSGKQPSFSERVISLDGQME